jgi:hypothetical protein
MRFSTTHEPRLGVRFLVALAGLAWAATAFATPPLQRKAKELGYPADDCAYCHSFTMEHMQKRAREMGLHTMNCMTCHGDRLPKTGTALYSERGKWLLAEKQNRKAPLVDVAWLKDYVEPKKASPGPTRP